MDLLRCHAVVLHTPFEAYGLHPYQKGNQGVHSSIPLLHVSPTIDRKPVGVKGLRVLAVQNRHDINEESMVLSNLKMKVDVSQVPLRFVSRHKRGQLIVWDGSTSDMIGSCSHGRNYTVTQCIMTEKFIFTTVEPSSPENVLDGEGHQIFQWDANSLQLLYTLRMKRRIEVMTLMCSSVGAGGIVNGVGGNTRSPQGKSLRLVTATDHSIDIWSFEEPKGLRHCCSINTEETQNPTKQLEVWNDFIFVAGVRHPLCVYDVQQNGKLIAASTEDLLDSSTSVQVVEVPDMNKVQSNAVLKFTVFTGTVQGFVKTWSFTIPSGNLSESAESANVSPVHLKAIESQKLHSSQISHLLADEDIVVAGNTYMGTTVLHRRERLITPLTHVPSRAMMIDKDNKRLIVGDDLGAVSVFSYAAYASQGRSIECLFSYKPHNGAVTGVYLQLGSGSMWERLTTCSMEGSVATLDFTDTKALLTLPEQLSMMDLHQQVAVSEMAIAMTDNASSQIHFFNAQFESNFSLPPLLLPHAAMGGGVRALCWIDWKTIALSFHTLNTVEIYRCEVNDDGEPQWELLSSWKLDCDARRSVPVIVCLKASPDHTLLVLGCDPDAGSGGTVVDRRGYLGLLRLNGVTVETLYNDVIDPIPAQGRIIATQESSAAATDYYVILQGESGDTLVYLFTSKQQPPLNQRLKRLRVCHSYVKHRKMSNSDVYGAETLCLPPSLAEVSIVASSSRVRFGFIDAANGGAYFAELSPGLTSVEGRACPIPRPTEGEGAEGVAAKMGKTAVVGISLTDVNGLQAALIREGSSTVEVVLQDGTLGYLLTYDGDVQPVAPYLISARRRPNVFPAPPTSTSPSSSGRGRVFCASIATQEEGRYVAVGYSNGLVQAFDVLEGRLISRWFTPHVGKQMSIRALPNGVLVTSENCPYIAVYAVPRRFVYDAENNPPHELNR